MEGTLAELTSQETITTSTYVRSGDIAVGEDDWDVGIQEMYALPSSSSLGSEALRASTTIDFDQHVTVRFHRLPKGTVELRRQSPVTSSDGHHVGHVTGFVIDDLGQIVHLVVEHGHLWGKREITVPISAVDRITNDEVTLKLSKDQVGELRSVPVRRW